MRNEDKKQMLEQIEEIIEKKVRPSLQKHGGDARLISYDDGICRVRLLGNCAGCPSAILTNEEIIGAAIMEALPQVRDVVLVQETSQDLLDMARKLLHHDPS